MSALRDILNGSLRKALGNRCLSKITLAINGAAAATVKSTGAINYCIDGIFYTKAALAAQSIAVTHDFQGNPVSASAISSYVLPAGKTMYLLLCLNAAGTVAVVQGSYEGQSIPNGTDKAKVLVGNGDIPAEPAGYTAIGLIKITTAGAATFTPGTTALDAANVTATYHDLAAVPTTAP